MKHTKQTEEQGVIILTEVVEEEGDLFVSTCKELGTSSCGDSIEEALSNLEEAIWVHLNALQETGERDRVFREKGIDIRPMSQVATLSWEVPLGKVVKTAMHQIPVLA